MNSIIKNLIPVIQTISLTFGKNCEVVLHDLSGPFHSIISIENGHVTGRKVGDPITDFILAAWRQGGFGNEKENKSINYKTKTKDGRILKSSSVFIKNNDKIIGCICINIDITLPLIFEKKLNEFCNIVELNNGESETFTSIDIILENIIDKAIEEVNKPVSLMHKEDKIRVVEIVDQKGIFMIKGAIDLIASKLNISRYTIYNYLDEIKIKKRNEAQKNILI